MILPRRVARHTLRWGPPSTRQVGSMNPPISGQVVSFISIHLMPSEDRIYGGDGLPHKNPATSFSSFTLFSLFFFPPLQSSHFIAGPAAFRYDQGL